MLLDSKATILIINDRVWKGLEWNKLPNKLLKPEEGTINSKWRSGQPNQSRLRSPYASLAIKTVSVRNDSSSAREQAISDLLFIP